MVAVDIAHPAHSCASRNDPALENLVVLRYAFNETCTQVLTIEQLMKDKEVRKRWPNNNYLYEDFRVNLRSKTWSFRENSSKIGQGSTVDRSLSYFIIGVYDRTNISHLNAMIRD